MHLWPGLGNHDYANNANDTFQNHAAIRMSQYMHNFLLNNNDIRSYDFKVGEETKLSKSEIDLLHKNIASSGNKSPNFESGVVNKNFTGSMAYSFDNMNYHFVQLQNYPTYTTSYGGYILGFIRYEQYYITTSLEWLKKDLEENKEKEIIINMHDFFEHFSNHEEFLNIIKPYKVRAIFGGHIHEEIGPSGRRGNIPIFFCGSAEYQKFLSVDFYPDKFVVQSIYSNNGKPIVIKTWSSDSKNKDEIPIEPTESPEGQNTIQEAAEDLYKSTPTTETNKK